MGRRALRKINPALDLTGRFLKLPTELNVWDAAAMFRRTAPLEVEIGSGKGLFLAGAAAAQPERDFVGIEVAFKYARFAAARLAKANLTNGLMIHGDAMRFVTGMLSDASLAGLHIYFPDPWWKKRHRKRRIMNPTLLAHAVRTLQPGGRLHFWTDVEEYFHEALALLATEPRLAGPLAVPERPAAHHLDYHTHFERRMRLTGQPVYRSEFERTGAPASVERVTKLEHASPEADVEIEDGDDAACEE